MKIKLEIDGHLWFVLKHAFEEYIADIQKTAKTASTEQSKRILEESAQRYQECLDKMTKQAKAQIKD